MARIQKKRKPPRSKKRIRPRSTKMKAISTLPHPWRLCPAGEHWVHTHPLQVPPSKSHPDGYVTTRHGHCARNPSGKDQMYPDEMHEIANERFSTVKGKPCSLELSFGKNGSAYDELIAGWVQYWNEVFQPQDLLDPDLFKALVVQSGIHTRLSSAQKIAPIFASTFRRDYSRADDRRCQVSPVWRIYSHIL